MLRFERKSGCHISLKGLAKKLNSELNRKANRPTKQRIAERVGDFLLEHDRLIVDAKNSDDALAYIIADDGAALPVNKDNRLFRAALQDSGLNPTEPVFAWTCEALNHRAMREGRTVRLERYSFYNDGILYLSAGADSIVIIRIEPRGPSLSVKRNGDDGILFAADGCFPKWTPSKTPIDLWDLDVFQPKFKAPPEVPAYDAVTQRLLLQSWAIGLLARVTLPILTCIGSKGSGKSILLRAMIKLLGGDVADISNQPKNPGDFFAAATSLPVYGIDNLDAQPSVWFLDAIASACTGVSLTDRQFYTNSTLFRKPVTAAFAVTTRTAMFASRGDVTERVLPIFFDDLPQCDKKDDKELLRQVIMNRDHLLTGLAYNAIRCLDADSRKAGLPGRFQGFARLVEAGSSNGRDMLAACEQAQFLSIVDPDPFMEAIIEYTKSHGPLRGAPVDILKQASQHYTVPPQGGGKRIASKIRELKPTLKLHGVSVQESPTPQGKTTFVIYR
jgi:hypothetical protein